MVSGMEKVGRGKINPDGVGQSLADLLEGFVQQLRAAGLMVSLSEYVDALQAIQHGALGDREVLRQSLAATLVKNQTHLSVFNTVFDLFFAVQMTATEAEDLSLLTEFEDQEPELDGQQPAPNSSVASEDLTEEELQRLALQSLEKDDDQLRAALVRQAVRRFAKIEPGRPVGGTYYLFKTISGLKLDEALGALLSLAESDAAEQLSPLEQRLASNEFERRIDALKAQIEAEIRRQMVAERGAETMSKSVRQALPEDVDFVHASRDELVALRKAMYPLTRKLAARLARKRRHRRRGPLDFRKTVRQSINYGGVPLEVSFRYPRPAKPELFVIADISGSVASFARFTLHLMYAISEQFSQVRSFVFIDGLDEITRLFDASDDITEAILRINAEADVIAADGHSDYGHAFKVFWDTYGQQVTSKSTVIVLGDARNNYHEPQAWILKELQRRARKVFWLNPEPKPYWDTGDSIIGDYSPYCDGAFETRNLRQLERFVDHLV